MHENSAKRFVNDGIAASCGFHEFLHLQFSVLNILPQKPTVQKAQSCCKKDGSKELLSYIYESKLCMI